MPFPIPRWGWYALGGIAAALAILLAVWAIHRDGYKDGKRDADAAWQEASDKLIEDAARAGTKADKQAAARAADFAAKQEDEKQRIDAAVADGSSPLDAIFGEQK